MEVPHINLHFATLVINSCDTDSNDWVRYCQVHSVHDDLKAQLPLYLLKADGVSTKMIKLQWWQSHEEELP